MDSGFSEFGGGGEFFERSPMPAVLFPSAKMRQKNLQLCAGSGFLWVQQ